MVPLSAIESLDLRGPQPLMLLEAGMHANTQTQEIFGSLWVMTSKECPLSSSYTVLGGHGQPLLN